MAKSFFEESHSRFFIEFSQPVTAETLQKRLKGLGLGPIAQIRDGWRVENDHGQLVLERPNPPEEEGIRRIIRDEISRMGI